MAQITLTLDLTPETLEILKLLASASSTDSGADAPKNEKPVPDDATAENEKDKKPAKKSASKDKKAAPKEEPAEADEAKDEDKAPSLTDVRAVALKLSKAGKQTQLKEIFAKYGAAKLSDIAEEHYADLMADLEAVNE